MGSVRNTRLNSVTPRHPNGWPSKKGEYVPGVGYVYVDKANVEHRLTQPRLEEILKQAIETNTLDSEMVARIKKDMEQKQANSTQTVEVEAEAVA